MGRGLRALYGRSDCPLFLFFAPQGPLQLAKLSYDLYAPAKWEYLLVDLAMESVGAAEAEDGTLTRHTP